MKVLMVLCTFHTSSVMVIQLGETHRSGARCRWSLVSHSFSPQVCAAVHMHPLLHGYSSLSSPRFPGAWLVIRPDAAAVAACIQRMIPIPPAQLVELILRTQRYD